MPILAQDWVIKGVGRCKILLSKVKLFSLQEPQAA